MKKELKNFVIGVDGGGTKTIAALANLEGKILKTAKTGPSSPRNVGTEVAVKNIIKAINKVLRKGRILSTFIGLAVIEEEPRFRGKIRKGILKQKRILQASKGKLKIGSDQIIAFRAGADEREGVLLIAGTGCVAHGWRKDKEAHSSGWGWLSDEGSAFWVGQRAFQAVFKELDGRGAKTLITKMVFRELKIKDKQDLMLKVYSKNPTEIIPFFSVVTDKAGKKGDKIAKKILKQAGKELALSAKIVIRRLGFRKKKFPLVLVGSMFNSEILLKTVKKEIKAFASEVKFIQFKKEPVIGAIKLAIEGISKKR